MQRRIPYVILFVLFISSSNFVVAQTQSNPYKTIGKEMEIIDTSKGRYEETIQKDSLERIGSVIINRYTRKIERLLDDDSLDRYPVCVSSQSRFLSIDPLTKDYAELTPYQFASNRPIQAIDLDGLEAYFNNSGEFIKYGKDISKTAPVILLANDKEVYIGLTIQQFQTRVYWLSGEEQVKYLHRIMHIQLKTQRHMVIMERDSVKTNY